MPGRVVIDVQHLSKFYELGAIGGKTLSEDVTRWWAKLRGRPDPLKKIGEPDQTNREGNDLWALRDVSFSVTEGQVLGILGRNGAGKSTILKILSRITAPTSGRAVIRGRVGSLLEVGTGFHAELTGRENVYLNGAILGMKRAEITRKLDEIVDFAEMGRFLDTPTKRYSSGMTVRLAFSVAAHLDPEILIVDEVLAVGDAAFQAKCIGKLRGIRSEGRTILFVSHNHQVLKSICDSGLLMKEGRALYAGSISDVLTKYQGLAKKGAATGIVYSDEVWQKKSDGVHLRQVRIFNAATEEVADSLSANKPIHIRIIVETDLPREIDLSLTVESSKGIGGLHSCYSTTGELLALRAGTNEISATIPANILNEGEYSIGISGERPGISFYFYHPELGIIRIIDALTRGIPVSNYTNWRSAIRPEVIEWTCESPEIALASSEGV